MNSPIFIVGMARSGTTLMNTLLSAHSKIAIPLSETKFLVDLNQAKVEDFNAGPQNFETFWDEYIHGKRFTVLGLDSERVRDRILMSKVINYRTIFSSILETYAEKMDKVRWGEKTPDHYQFTEIILQWYPQAKIIWMLRDPRSVIASHLKVSWSKRSVEEYAKKWCDSLTNFEQRWAADSRVKLVKYEHLVRNPSVEIPEICKFLEEQFEDTLISGRSESTSPIINRTEEDKSFFRATLKPIEESNIDKWRTSLSKSQITSIENIVRLKMKAYGYNPETTALNPQRVRDLLSPGLRKIKHIKASFSES